MIIKDLIIKALKVLLKKYEDSCMLILEEALQIKLLVNIICL